MIDLRDDGTIGIDFEDGRGVVSIRRPKFGEFKRLRAEAARLGTAQQAKRDEITKLEQQDAAERDDPEASDEVRARAPFDGASLLEDASGELAAGWWLLVLRGDDTFKGLADKPVPEPDEWPSFMIVGTSIDADLPKIRLASGQEIPNRNGIIHTVLAHWRQVPLARGGQPVPQPNLSANGHSQVAGLTK